MSRARESSSAWSTSSLRSPKCRSTSCRQMTSASTAASTWARRARSCLLSSPTPWWVLNVTSRTGIGGWSGPGAGRVTAGSLSGRRHRHVEDLGEPVGAELADRQQEPGLAAGQDQLADLVAEERAGPLGPRRGPRPGLREPGQRRGEPLRAAAPADLEADPDRVW